MNWKSGGDPRTLVAPDRVGRAVASRPPENNFLGAVVADAQRSRRKGMTNARQSPSRSRSLQPSFVHGEPGGAALAGHARRARKQARRHGSRFIPGAIAIGLAGHRPELLLEAAPCQPLSSGTSGSWNSAGNSGGLSPVSPNYGLIPSDRPCLEGSAGGRASGSQRQTIGTPRSLYRNPPWQRSRATMKLGEFWRIHR